MIQPALESEPSPHDACTQMHIDLEQALREREYVNVRRFAPGPLAFNVAVTGREHLYEADDGAKGYRACTVYAQPYGQGYTAGAKPDEYVLICDGRQVWRRDADSYNPGYDKARGYSAGLTFSEVLAVVDAMQSSSWGADS